MFETAKRQGFAWNVHRPHTDADLGRDQECVNDTTKSRDFGLDHFRETRGAFFDLFDRLRAEKVIP